MSLISTWSTIANDNGTLGSTPQYWPEGQSPSSVNDCARLMMSSIRTQWNDAEWFNWGYTVARVAGNSFTVVTAAANTVTVANVFATGGRVKMFDTSTMYGTITTVSASAASVLVTFTPDTGSLTASFSSVYNSIITAGSKSLPSGSVPADVVRQSGAQIYGVDAGATDAYAVALTPTLTAYQAGQSFDIFCNTANTGAATLNIDGLGAVAITTPGGDPLPDNTIVGGQIIHVLFDGADFQMISTNSSGGSGGVSAATQADMEAGTSTTTFVSPGRIQYAPGTAKAWAEIQTNGTSTASYNCASFTDTGVGQMTANLTVPFTSTNYAVICAPEVTFNNTAAGTQIGGIASTAGASTVDIQIVRLSDYAFIDPNYFHFIAFGDQ